jgi:tetratricopeptide (TPR) repeat protein
MYLRGSKWSMRQRRKPTNWFLVVVLLLLIAIMVYIDRVVVPSVPLPFVPTVTATRDPESYITEAEGLFAQGKLLKAIDTYNDAIRIKPDDPTFYIAQARVQILAGKYDDALTNAENALLLNPNNSMAHAVRGWALTQKGIESYTNADTSIQRALELDPNNGLAHAYYAFLLGDMFLDNAGPYTDPIQPAIAESNAAISLAPNSLEAHWARGFILEITNNREQAVQEYQAAININQNIPELHLRLGVTYRAIGDIDKAIQEYTLANTQNPPDYRPELYSSRALGGIGSYEKAAQYAEQAVKDAPTDPYLRGNWGVWLYKIPDFPNAAIQLSLAINGGETEDGQTVQPVDPAVADIWIPQYFYTYAVLLARLNRCSEALQLSQQILTTFPTNDFAVSNAQYSQGLCQASLGTPSPVPTATRKPTQTP